MGDAGLDSLGQRRIPALTFDCYGTLVDWERGVCVALRGLLGPRAASAPREKLVEAFLAADNRLIARGVAPYEEVLVQAANEVAHRFDISLDRQTEQAFVASLPSWPLFEETNPALERLSEHYRLAIISNIDDRLIADTLKCFTVSFDMIMTSERAGSYKPDKEIFARALRELGEPPECVVHIAEGLCEATPVRELGMGSIWIKRSKHSDDGSGAVPDACVASLSDLLPALCPEL